MDLNETRQEIKIWRVMEAIETIIIYNGIDNVLTGFVENLNDETRMKRCRFCHRTLSLFGTVDDIDNFGV